VISPVQLPVETLNGFTGRYVFNEVLPVQVTVEEQHLRMVGDDGRIFAWYPTSDQQFIDTVTGWQLEFVFDDKNTVTGAVIDIGGARLKGEKIDN
jgi:hypothetical protein